MASAAALQAEFLRRIVHAENVASLFAAKALIPDFSGLRNIALLADKDAMQTRQVPGSDRVQVRLRVKLQLQAPFSSDCPAVDEFLAQIGENTRTWEETGWMDLTYQRSAEGWLIAGLAYLADKR